MRLSSCSGLSHAKRQSCHTCFLPIDIGYWLDRHGYPGRNYRLNTDRSASACDLAGVVDDCCGSHHNYSGDPVDAQDRSKSRLCDRFVVSGRRSRHRGTGAGQQQFPALYRCGHVVWYQHGVHPTVSLCGGRKRCFALRPAGSVFRPAWLHRWCNRRTRTGDSWSALDRFHSLCRDDARSRRALRAAGRFVAAAAGCQRVSE